MKNILLTCSLILFAANAAWARPDFKPMDFAPLFEKWQLTDTQVQELENYFEQHREARKAMREKNKEVRKAMKQSRKELRDQQRNDLATVLSEEQMEELHEYVKENRPRHFRHGRPPCEKHAKGEESDS